MTDDSIYPGPSTPAETMIQGDSKQKQPTPELKDYYCPYCGYKLFRGSVNEFKMVCMECNRLVDSKDSENSVPETE
ncbi:MAG: hypothetical protein MI892_19600 [Desulfobacterales bacterium]|nr:hypothetical protein [Desulfobacterales bacterium]